MRLLVATKKSTGTRYYYTTRVIFGRKEYSADFSGACVGEGAVKQTWHKSLSEARQAAEVRGTLLLAH